MGIPQIRGRRASRAAHPRHRIAGPYSDVRSGRHVFPEADEDDDEIEIDPKDLKIDIFMSSGPGGQSVNTTYSAVRMTHIPTGIVVSMQDEKSQIQNRAAALRVLKSRLLAMKHEEEAAQAADMRHSQVRSLDRSGTNPHLQFPGEPYRRSSHELQGVQPDAVLDGDLQAVIDSDIQAGRSRSFGPSEVKAADGYDYLNSCDPLRPCCVRPVLTLRSTMPNHCRQYSASTCRPSTKPC